MKITNQLPKLINKENNKKILYKSLSTGQITSKKKFFNKYDILDPTKRLILDSFMSLRNNKIFEIEKMKKKIKQKEENDSFYRTYHLNFLHKHCKEYLKSTSSKSTSRDKLSTASNTFYCIKDNSYIPSKISQKISQVLKESNNNPRNISKACFFINVCKHYMSLRNQKLYSNKDKKSNSPKIKEYDKKSMKKLSNWDELINIQKMYNIYLSKIIENIRNYNLKKDFQKECMINDMKKTIYLINHKLVEYKNLIRIRNYLICFKEGVKQNEIPPELSQQKYIKYIKKKTKILEGREQYQKKLFASEESEYSNESQLKDEVSDPNSIFYKYNKPIPIFEKVEDFEKMMNSLQKSLFKSYSDNEKIIYKSTHLKFDLDYIKEHDLQIKFFNEDQKIIDLFEQKYFQLYKKNLILKQQLKFNNNNYIEKNTLSLEKDLNKIPFECTPEVSKTILKLNSFLIRLKLVTKYGYLYLYIGQLIEGLYKIGKKFLAYKINEVELKELIQKLSEPDKNEPEKLREYSITALKYIENIIDNLCASFQKLKSANYKNILKYQVLRGAIEINKKRDNFFFQKGLVENQKAFKRNKIFEKHEKLLFKINCPLFFNYIDKSLYNEKGIFIGKNKKLIMDENTKKILEKKKIELNMKKEEKEILDALSNSDYN